MIRPVHGAPLVTRQPSLSVGTQGPTTQLSSDTLPFALRLPPAQNVSGNGGNNGSFPCSVRMSFLFLSIAVSQFCAIIALGVQLQYMTVDTLLKTLNRMDVDSNLTLLYGHQFWHQALHTVEDLLETVIA